MTKEKQEQIMLMVLTVGALAVGGFQLVLKPGMATLATTNASIATNGEQIVAMQKEVNNIRIYQGKVDTLKAALTNAEARFVGSGSYYEFLDLIKNCATNAGMMVTHTELRSDVQNIKRGLNYVENWVTVGSSPRYHALGKWLAEMERSPYLRIVECDITSGEGDEGMHAASVTISFLVNKGTE